MRKLQTSRPLVFYVTQEADHRRSLWLESIPLVHVHSVLAVGLACAADHTLTETFLFLLETAAAF